MPFLLLCIYYCRRLLCIMSKHLIRIGCCLLCYAYSLLCMFTELYTNIFSPHFNTCYINALFCMIIYCVSCNCCMQSQNNLRILLCENVLSGLERSCGEMCQKTCSNAVGGLINLLSCAFLIQGIPESSLPSMY